LADQRLPAVQMESALARKKLVRLLQDAHAGEWAAALAYHGHALSVNEPLRSEIRQIQTEELAHRQHLFNMLQQLHEKPRRWRELQMKLVGHFISFVCRVGGFLIPMYGAGKLERGNIVEYEVAARLALLSGHPQFVEDLIEFAEVEWDHEQYFRRQTLSHPLMKWLPIWPATAARGLIREELKLFTQAFVARQIKSSRSSQNATVVSAVDPSENSSTEVLDRPKS
jgi:hypothetical protein